MEPKWDVQRIQAHAWILRKKAKGKRQKEIQTIFVKLFTRSLEDVTEMFPDLTDALKTINNQQSTINNCIFDGEVVAIDPRTGRTLPFQTMITRKRKYGIQEKLADVPVRYMVFDILYLNGKSLLNEEFIKRRQILGRSLLGGRQGDSSSDSIIQLAPQLVTSDPAEIRKFLKQQIAAGLEGIVAKRSDAPYIPGRTRFAWVKLKWEGAAKSGGLLDTVDCVVMGTYGGRGKRAGFGVGAFLVGILGYQSSVIGSRLPVNQFSVNQSKTGKPITDKPITENRKLKTDNGVFLTISKIGTGLTDEQWRELKAEGRRLKAEGKPKEYEVPKELTPDVWLKPELVVEIQADNITKSPLHSAGYALRFPRLVRYRSDKRPEQTTMVEEVEKLYEMQFTSTHPRSWRKPQLPPR